MITWTNCGPFGLRSELSSGVVLATWTRRDGQIGWSMSHRDVPALTRGLAASVFLARQAMLAAAPDFAAALADALDARSVLLAQRAAVARARAAVL